MIDRAPAGLPPPPPTTWPLASFGCVVLVIALFAVGALGLVDYRVLHALTELACLAAATAAFLVIWNARAFVENGFFLLLGAAFLVAAAYAALHILSVLGLVRYPLAGPVQESIWTAEQAGLAATLCLGIWLWPSRTISGGLVLVLVLAGNTALGAILGLVTGSGRPAVHAVTLTMFVAAGAGLWRRRTTLGPPMTALLAGTVACLAVAEIASLQPAASFWSNLLAHGVRLLGFCLGCRAAVVTGVDAPHERLRTEITRREQELATRMVRLTAQAGAIYDLAGLASLEHDEFDGFAATLAEKSATVLDVARAGVWLLSPDGFQLVCQAWGGVVRAETGAVLRRSEAPAYFDALAHERVLAVHDIAASLLTRPLATTVRGREGLVSLLDAPVRFSGRLAGVLTLEHTGSPRRFADDEQAFAGSMADLLALALEATARSRTARDLAESELRLRTLLDAMPDPVCFKDATGHWIVANQAMLDTFGLTGQSWEGRTNPELAEFSTNDREAFLLAVKTDRQTWVNRRQSVFDLSTTSPDGRTRHFDVIKAPLYHADGRPKGLVSLWRDVTAHRDALTRLREKNEELEAIYNETSDGLIIADIDNRSIVRVNAAACRMFGYAPKALTALSPWDLHPVEERMRSLQLFEAIATGRLRLLEGIPCRRADGELFFVDIAAQRITYDGRTAILGFYRDISERRRAEEALKASEARFRRVFDSTSDAIILHDENGVILDLNDMAVELFGVRRDEAAAFSLDHDYSAADNPPGKLHAHWHEAAAGQDCFFEWQARRPHDGSVFSVEVYLRRIELAGRPVILANVRDVTERKRVLAALAARQEEISALNRDLAVKVREETEKNRQKDLLLLNRTRLAAMGEMIGNIAHQWRQPLNALSILLANLRFEYETACDGDIGGLLAAHAQAREILRKMSGTIEDFRNFFKPDKQRAVFPVVEAVSDALLLLEASLAQHGVTVRFTARNNPRVFGFRGEFSQVMLNLLSNARDAVLTVRPAGGTVDIRVMERHGRAVVHVTDNGGGIAPEALPRIFDPYFTTKSDKGGTGLGLYMSKTIIEEHMQGSLTAANTADGARFAVRVPLAPLPAGPHAAPTVATRN